MWCCFSLPSRDFKKPLQTCIQSIISLQPACPHCWFHPAVTLHSVSSCYQYCSPGVEQLADYTLQHIHWQHFVGISRLISFVPALNYNLRHCWNFYIWTLRHFYFWLCTVPLQCCCMTLPQSVPYYITLPYVNVMFIAGISGWYPVTAASYGWDIDDKSTEQRRSELSCRLDRVVGGIELSLKFAHNDDRDRVIHAARGVGWASVHDVEHRDWCEAGKMMLFVVITCIAYIICPRFIISCTCICFYFAFCVVFTVLLHAYCAFYVCFCYIFNKYYWLLMCWQYFVFIWEF